MENENVKPAVLKRLIEYEVIVKKCETKIVNEGRYRAIEGQKEEDGSQKYGTVYEDCEKEVSTEVLKFRLTENQLDVRHLAAFLSGRT